MAQMMLAVGGDNLIDYTLSQGDIPVTAEGFGTDPTVHGMGGYGAIRHVQRGIAKTEMAIYGYDENNRQRLQVHTAEYRLQLQNEIEHAMTVAKETGATTWDINLHLVGANIGLGGRDLNSELEVRTATRGTKGTFNDLNALNEMQTYSTESRSGRRKADPRLHGVRSAYAAREAIQQVNADLQRRREAGESIPEFNINIANTAYGTGTGYNGTSRIPDRMPRLRR
jgi:hypothetical protein